MDNQVGIYRYLLKIGLSSKEMKNLANKEYYGQARAFNILKITTRLDDKKLDVLYDCKYND